MPSVQLERTLVHLKALVERDTRNPPRATRESGIAEYVGAALRSAGCDVEERDLGEGCVTVLGVRGAPRFLFNFHLDTVPANPSWTRDPFSLVVDGERAFGLGACDIKGAAAAMIAALEQRSDDVAVLFSTDEEAGQGRCISSFLSEHADASARYEAVFVGEPTGGRAVLAHRGIGSAAAVFSGRAGHASEPRALEDNALHAALRWGARALGYAAEQESVVSGGLRGLRLNVGKIAGGEKSNMIAAEAEVRFGIRPPPGRGPEEVAADLMALAPTDKARWSMTFVGPPLPAEERLLERARSLCDELSLPVAPPVDFWTEASLFSAAGMIAVVLGSGDIAQAHSADEWVSLSSLDEIGARYAGLLGGRP